MGRLYSTTRKLNILAPEYRGCNLPEAATTAMPGFPELSKKDRTRLLLSGDQIVSRLMILIEVGQDTEELLCGLVGE